MQSTLRHQPHTSTAWVWDQKGANPCFPFPLDFLSSSNATYSPQGCDNESMTAIGRDCMHLDSPTMGKPMTPAFTQPECPCINLCYAMLNLSSKRQGLVTGFCEYSNESLGWPNFCFWLDLKWKRWRLKGLHL